MKAAIALLLVLLAACTQVEYPQPPCELLSDGSDNAPAIIFYNDGLNETAFDAAVGNATTYLKESVWGEANLSKYQITGVNDSACKAEKNNNINPVLVCDKELVRPLLQACGEPHIILVAFTDEYVIPRGTVTYGDNSFISISPELFLDRTEFLHEMGHTIGLRDEYVKGVKVDGAAGTPGPNCLPNGTAQEHWGNDAEPGCAGNPLWYHPADSGQVMRAQHGDDAQYGSTNEAYIKSVIDCCYRENRTTYACGEFFSAYPAWSSCRE